MASRRVVSALGESSASKDLEATTDSLPAARTQARYSRAVPSPLPNLNEARQRAQVALLDSGAEVRLGSAARCPRPPWLLAALTPESEGVEAVIRSGLTAEIFRLREGGRAWAIKRVRLESLVRNVDGRVAFLNELQRRGELEALREARGGLEGILPAVYGSLREGLLVSPWIDALPEQPWDDRALGQLFAAGAQLVREGFFEWDYCPGNLLDDGRQVWLFDFGYLYPFDPLTQLNTAGDGLDCPQFHLAERFETRNYFAFLLELEEARGGAAALEAFRREKRIAVECYTKLREDLAARGARPVVLGWLDGLRRHWQARLQAGLEALYLEEGRRSHRLDLDDDLHGGSCTPMTLRRCDWMLAALTDGFDALRSSGALAHEPVPPEREGLLAYYRKQRERAEGSQIQRGRPHGKDNCESGT
jgi:hypothetical protein